MISPKPKPAKREKKAPKPLKRSWIKAKPGKVCFTPSERVALERQLDLLCAEYIRERDRKCVVCGTRKDLTCGHFIKRSVKRFRYDIEVNLNCQCRWCNAIHNADPSDYERYMVETYGKKVVEALKKEAEAPDYKWSVPELRARVKNMIVLVRNLDDV